MVCKNCGAKVKDGLRFCKKCGTDVFTGNVLSAHPIGITVKKQECHKLIKKLVIAVIVIIIIAFGVFFFIQKR